MSDAREVKLTRIGRNQEILIPEGFELPGDTAIIRRMGSSLVIEPVPKKRLLDLLATWEPIEDDFPDFDNGLLPARDVDL